MKRHGRFTLLQNHDFGMVIARTYLRTKMAIRLIRANDGKRDSGNREGPGDPCRIDETEEAAAGCGEPKDESPTVAVPVASSDNRETKLSP